MPVSDVASDTIPSERDRDYTLGWACLTPFLYEHLLSENFFADEPSSNTWYSQESRQAMAAA